MHALITADTIGGVWTYVRELVTGLARRGVRVTLVSFGDVPTPQQTAWMDALDGVDYRPTAFRLEWMQESAEDIEISSEYLASITREVKPDVLHLNQYCYGNLPVDVPRIVVAHSDVVSWWVAVHGEEPPESEWIRWYRETVRRGLVGATTVVAPSQWMMNAIREHYIRPEHRAVIYNGRNRNLFNPRITKERYALSVGRLWDAGKQVSILKDIDSPVPVYIAGATNHPDAAFRGDVRAGGAGNVYFKDHQGETQLRNLYARAGIYLATSRYEPFGLAPVEAALSRCAIIANDIPSFREIWGDTVCYFRSNDPDSLRDSLERFCRDENERMHYANVAYERARERFTADRMVDEYLELYRTAVAAEATAA
jgi:glycogen(starch) synthase